ncbi:MAG: hypothetical protein AAF843_04865 [Bacteroidota bacterium]
MINFVFKRPAAKIKSVLEKQMQASYQRDFNKALINLELNLQEERVRKSFKNW